MANTRYKILLVEDDKLDQKAFKRLVKDKNLPYDCTVAGSVSEAKSILNSEKFDIVIADYMLGDGTVFDVLDLVKDTPVIFVTGAGDEEVATKAWKDGAYDYLIKDQERNYLKAVPITIENAIKHKKAKAKLQLLSGAVMNTDDSVYITDMDNKIIFVNKAFCKTYGYNKQEIVGEDSNILWMGKPQSDGTRSVFQAVGGSWEVGFYQKRKDDSVFSVSLSRAIIKNENGDEVAVANIARDISEQILIEDELRKTNRKLEEENQLKSKLVIAVSEKLKMSLTTLKNIICDAKTDAPNKISPRLKENLELADKNIDSIRGIISDFLDISEIDAGKINLELTEFNLHSVLSEVLETLSPFATKRNIELESSIPDSELLVNADYERITQVLINLISNSIKSVSANGHISVRAKDIGKEIVVEVQDDGPAIKSGKIKEIFNHFDQIRKQGHLGKEKITTLSWPIVKELVEMHGGRIWVENKNGQGNNFCFTLPKAGVSEEIAAVVKAERR